MRNTGKIRVVSVQSRKGGIGKTTIALSIAAAAYHSEDTNVIYLDLDITGTASADFGGNPLWEHIAHVVQAPGEKKADLNLVHIFENYMTGESAPPVTFDETKKEKEEKRIHLEPRKINIFNSFLEREYNGGSSDKYQYSPAALFDELHSEWFMEMLKELIGNCLTAFTEGYKNRLNEEDSEKALTSDDLLVVIDNAPGYTGLLPAVEDWLSDLGPEYGKMLFVGSIDKQDLSACAKGLKGVSRLFADKWDALLAHMELLKPDLDPAAAKAKYSSLSAFQKDFIKRLVNTEPPKDTKCAVSPITPVGCTNCELCFYREKIRKNETSVSGIYTSDSVYPDKFVNIVFNKIPPDPDKLQDGSVPTWLEKHDFKSLLKNLGYEEKTCTFNSLYQMMNDEETGKSDMKDKLSSIFLLNSSEPMTLADNDKIILHSPFISMQNLLQLSEDESIKFAEIRKDILEKKRGAKK